MKTGARRGSVVLLLEGELVVAAGRAVADGLVWFAGPDVRPDALMAERREGRVVEGGRAFDVAHAEGKMAVRGPSRFG